MSKRLLFVSHSASRSGAPMMLLHLLRWLQAHTSYQLELLLLRGGPLAAELYAAAKPAAGSGSLRVINAAATARARLKQADPALRFLRRGGPALAAAERAAAAAYALAAAGARYDLIYANTAATGQVLPALKRFGCPVLSHIHELEYALGEMAPAFAKVRSHSTHFVAASRAVAQNLTLRHGIAAASIDVVYEFIETAAMRVDGAAARLALRRELGLADDAFVVGGAGMLEWRKGSDLFVQLAAALAEAKGPAGGRAGRDIALVWMGGDPGGAYGRQLQYEARRRGLSSRVFWIGERARPATFFAALDAFALTSREDPFPLVCLEAAACGVPLTCFAESGGIPELLEEGGGAVVPYLDCTAMAAVLRRFESDEPWRRACGTWVQQRVLTRHDVAVGAPQIAAVIERTLAL